MPKKLSSPRDNQLFIRLLPEVDDRLRTLIRKRGDISRIVTEAVMAVPDLDELDVQRIEGVTLVQTTVTLTARCRRRLKRAAVESMRRGGDRSMNALVNAALARYLDSSEKQ